MARSGKGAALALAVIITTTAVLPYVHTLGYGFTHWDDPSILTENPAVRHFTPVALEQALRGPVGETYLPVRLISHMVEYRLWGLRPLGYHATNVLLNGFVCVALAAAVGQVLPRRVAAIAAILYALQPTHVEAVAWVSGRKEVLSAGLMFAAAWAFFRSERRGRLSGWCAAAVCALALAGMFAKPTAVVLPGLLLCGKLAMGALDRAHRRGTWLIAALAVAAVAAACIHAGVGAAHDVVKPQHGGSFGRNALFAAHALVEHLRLCLWPVGLSVRYMPQPARPVHAVAALVLVACLVAAAVEAAVRRRIGVPSLCALWFAVALAPTSTLFFPTSTTIADRYLYVASLGPCLFIAWLLDRLARSPVRAVLTVAALSLTALSVQRSAVWRDDGHLWRHAVVDSPSISGLHLSLAAHYTDVGLYRRAEGQIERILGAGTTVPRAAHNLAVVKCRLGRPEQAMRLFRRAVRLLGPNSPASAGSYNGMGLVLRDRGDLVGAEHYFREALRVQPHMLIAQMNLAHSLEQQGRLDDALPVYREMLAAWPDHGPGHAALGKLLYRRGQWAEALSRLRRAMETDGPTAETQAYAGLCHIETGRMSDAKVCLAAAMALDERYWTPHYLAGRICEAMGDLERAKTGYRYAMQYNSSAQAPAERLRALTLEPKATP